MRSYVHTYTCIIYCCTVVFYVLYKRRLGFTVHLLIFKLKMRSIIETIGEYLETRYLLYVTLQFIVQKYKIYFICTFYDYIASVGAYSLVVIARYCIVLNLVISCGSRIKRC